VGKKATAPDYYWYQDLRELLNEAGQYSPQFQFWTGIIGGSSYQELIDVNQFCETFFEDEIPWTLESFASYGTKYVLDNYCKNLMRRRFCE